MRTLFLLLLFFSTTLSYAQTDHKSSEKETWQMLMQSLVPDKIEPSTRELIKAINSVGGEWDNYSTISKSTHVELSGKDGKKIKTNLTLYGRDSTGYSIFMTTADLPVSYSFKDITDNILLNLKPILVCSHKDLTNKYAKEYWNGYEVTIPGKKTVWLYIYTALYYPTSGTPRQTLYVVCFFEKEMFMQRSTITNAADFGNALENMFDYRP